MKGKVVNERKNTQNYILYDVIYIKCLIRQLCSGDEVKGFKRRTVEKSMTEHFGMMRDWIWFMVMLI